MPTRLFGYVRVSTADQNPEMQVSALVDAGVNRDYIFEDAKSGRKLKNRDGLRRVLRNMREGDTLVVWRCLHPLSTNEIQSPLPSGHR